MAAVGVATLAAGVMAWRTAITGRSGESIFCLALGLAGMAVLGASS